MEPYTQLTHQAIVLCYHVHIRGIYTTIDGQIITAGELVAKEKYICSMQIDTNWYWNQQPKHHVTTVPTFTEQRYFVLITNSTSVIIFPSIVVLS